MELLLHYYSTVLDTRKTNLSAVLQYLRIHTEPCVKCKLQYSTFPRKGVRVRKMVLTESVSVTKLVLNAKTVNINTNMSGVVNATVIQHLEANCCWYVIIVEMIEQGNFLFHLKYITDLQ